MGWSHPFDQTPQPPGPWMADSGASPSSVPVTPVRRDRRPASHFSFPGADFAKHRCNRLSALRGVRICFPGGGCGVWSYRAGKALWTRGGNSAFSTIFAPLGRDLQVRRCTMTSLDLSTNVGHAGVCSGVLLVWLALSKGMGRMRAHRCAACSFGEEQAWRGAARGGRGRPGRCLAASGARCSRRTGPRARTPRRTQPRACGALTTSQCRDAAS